MTAEPLRHADSAVPRPLLIAAAAMLAASVIGAGLGRHLGLDGDPPIAASGGAPTALREMRFVDRSDGGIDVVDGFARATLRGLVRDRKKLDLGPETPFRLTMWPDGRLVLDDPATGRHVDLRAFGPTNRDAFARLLPRMDGAPAGERR
jgi:putative photosynthetic complex assembly protein